MSTFNFDFGSDIHVKKSDDSVKVVFEGDTFSLNQTSDGFTLTNDWNDRHFTMAFGENSLLYHITREGSDESGSGKNAVPPEEFVAEMLGYIRAIAPPIPTDELNIDFVGKVDVEELREFFEDAGVINNTAMGVRIDHEKKKELVNSLADDRAELGKFYQRVLEDVSFDEAKGDDSEHIYVLPTEEEILVMVTFPPDYVGLTTLSRAAHCLTEAGGSQIVDHIFRAVANS